MVGVLELVDQHETVAGAEPRQKRRPLPQQAERAVDLVAEVDEPGLGQQPLVRLVELSELQVARRLVALGLARRGRELRLGPGPVLRRRDVLVLGPAHERRERGQVAGRIAERPEAPQRQREQTLAQEDDLLRLREHAELRVEAGLERGLAQHAIAEGVEGQDRRLRVAVGDELIHPLGHLGRGLLGEGEGEDLLGADDLGRDQVRDAAREDGGLARAGAGDDEQRPFAVADGLALRLVQPLEDPLFGGSTRRLRPRSRPRLAPGRGRDHGRGLTRRDELIHTQR